MAVTIRKIAEVSGYSRGTVDRVLNNRGKVGSEAEARIRKVAADLNYVPNLAGKVLAAQKKAPVIGAVLPSEGNPFFDDVIRGIRKAAGEISDYGATVEIRTMRGYDPGKQAKLIDALSDRISALILTPVDDPVITRKIDELAARGVPTVTLNTDIQNSARVFYVGSDYLSGGKIACGMLALVTGGKACVGVVSGSKKVLGHKQRVAGFLDVMRAKYPEMRAVGFVDTNDDDITSYNETSKMLKTYPEISGLFIVAAGVYGACRVILDAGLEGKIPVVSFDSVPTTIEMMDRGIIRATICQQPEQQGYQATRAAFDCCLSGSPSAGSEAIIENKIIIPESL